MVPLAERVQKVEKTVMGDDFRRPDTCLVFHFTNAYTT